MSNFEKLWMTGCLSGTEVNATGHCIRCDASKYNDKFKGVCRDCPEGQLADKDNCYGKQIII